VALPTDQLSIKAAALSRIAPEYWQAFLAELGAYSEASKDAVVTTTIEHLQVFQGRAQALRHLMTILHGAASTAAKLESRK